jgi:hypothetical protein
MKELYWAIETFLRTGLLSWAESNIPFILFGLLFFGFGLFLTIIVLLYFGRKLNKIIDYQLMIGAEVEKLLERQIDLLKNLFNKTDYDKDQNDI